MQETRASLTWLVSTGTRQSLPSSRKTVLPCLPSRQSRLKVPCIRHGDKAVPLSPPTWRCHVRVPRLVTVAILTLLPVFAVAADVLPPTQLPESGAGLVPDINSERPSESGVSIIPPSRIDPGIEHKPARLGDPRGSVKPPNLDSNMSTNPDVAPSPREGANPSGEGTPQGKPNVR
jgi:hypothetical protein